MLRLNGLMYGTACVKDMPLVGFRFPHDLLRHYLRGEMVSFIFAYNKLKKKELFKRCCAARAQNIKTQNEKKKQ